MIKAKKNNKSVVVALCKKARVAARTLALVSNENKNKALTIIAEMLRASQKQLLSANKKDLISGKQKKLSAAFLDRLMLNSDRIEAMAKGLEAIAKLPDPVGNTLAEFKRPNGLHILRVSVPLGVIAVVYESRPNVTVDAAGLALKSGNAVILRGGSESFNSSKAILLVIKRGLKAAKLPSTCVQMLPSANREMLTELIKQDQWIDVLIPRGGPQLISFISKHSRIPLFKHLAGLCHTYIHSAADPNVAKKIVLNAKMRRTGICGATEVLLIDKSITSLHLPNIINVLLEAGCEVRGDKTITKLNKRVKQASEIDFTTEFLAPIIAIKQVADLKDAINHIETHGTHHTDAIITEDKKAAETFFKEIDSAIVMHNTSTQFADGGEFGMGAEIGIATGKLHARGPVGVEQLTTFKYVVKGSGQIRS